MALVAYHGLRSFEYAIAADIFAIDRDYLGVPWYETFVVTPDRGRLQGAGGLEVRATAPFEAIDTAQTIVLPGWRDVEAEPPQPLLLALRRALARGARVLSLCSGAFALGSAGLLDGRRATTHWLFADIFRRRFPHAHYEADVLYVDEGPVITSAGSAAGLDACLHLIRRDHGADVANRVARRMVVAPHREGGQAQYVEAPVAPRVGRGIAPAMDWALAHLDQPIAIGQLARHAAMSERTFLRRFHEATGMAPREWLQHQRVLRARALLEAQPDRPSADVAAQCGFASVETFRAAFRRQVGLPPASYRARFAAGATAASAGRAAA